MDGFERLLSCAGEWAGRNRVQPCVADPINESASELSVMPILNRTFLRIDQRWSWNDQPQAGSMLIGYQPREATATIDWVDTWHNGRRSMILLGRFDTADHDKLIAFGHFPVDAGPEWGWRIEIQPDGDDGALHINMFCINPASGRDEGWVWSEFVRRKT